MKTRKYVLILLAIAGTLFIVLCRILASQYEHEIGRDTHKAFGNREYQILNIASDKFSTKRCLYNVKYNESVIDTLSAYKTYGKYVYFCGDNDLTYIKLNKKNNCILYYKMGGCTLLNKCEWENNGDIEIIDSYEMFSDVDKMRFENIKN